MSSKKLHIIIFDGTLDTTTFIRRLVKGLIAKELLVTIIGFNDSGSQRVTGANYIPLGSNHSFLRLIWQSCKIAIGDGRLRIILKSLQYIFKYNRLALQTHNLTCALRKLDPDIVHLQWPSLITWVEKELVQGEYNFVLSQRGFHVNVRPFVDPDNFNYLKTYYPFFNGLHSVSRAISDVGNQIYSSEKKLDKVIYSGFDLNAFSFKNSYNKRPCLQIISVGRAHWKKGYAHAINAFRILRDKQVDFHYTIIGAEGDEELLYSINDAHLNSFITLTSNKTFDEVVTLVNNSDLMLLPSIEEGIANVVIEAMLLGIPVVSTECGGMTEVIENGKSGWLVPLYDAMAIAKAVEDFIQLDDLTIQRIRTEARKKVEAQHNMEQMIDGMLDLYSCAQVKEEP